jgi:diketogulonate reductase-like aldo/keto reductase
MVGYSPFGSPDLPWGRTDLPHILVDPVLLEIAGRYKKSTAQIVLKWNIQGGLGICPKSVFTNELGKIYKLSTVPGT